MIKGWKNNPQWIEYYERKQKEKLERKINNWRLSMQAEERLRKIEQQNRESQQHCELELLEVAVNEDRPVGKLGD